MNYQRGTWTILLLVGLFALLVVYMMLEITPGGAGSGGAATQRVAATQGAETAATEKNTGGTPVARVLAGGDERTLWVVRPRVLESSGKKISVYELMARTSDGGWTAVRDKNGGGTFSDHPRALAVVSPVTPVSGRKVHATAYVFGSQEGAVQLFALNGETVLVDNLPPEHELLAVAGNVDGAFALTRGVPSESTTRPGDVLNLRGVANAPATMGAETAPATSTAPAIGPTTTSAAPKDGSLKAVLRTNAYLFHTHWKMLPVMEEEGSAGSVPGEGAMVGMACVRSRLVAMWVDPGNERVLVARGLDYRNPDARWGKAVRSELPAGLGKGRLMPVVLGETLYVLWAVEEGGDAALRGGWMITNGTGADLRLEGKNFLPTMVLKGVGAVKPGNVAVGPMENSLGVVVNGAEGLKGFVLDGRGSLVSGPTAVKMSEKRDVQFAQNLALMLLALMLGLSLWQWRQRPEGATLPTGMMVASAGRRAAAFLIDVGIAFVVVCTMYGMWETGEWFENVTGIWSKSIMNPEGLINSPMLIWFWGIYLAHVAVGELVFHRSIGKALLGLKVMMVDGRAPTLAAIVVRNLIRLPELLLGILVVYFFISGNRQRLGDLIGGTVVVMSKPPQVFEDEES